MMTRKHYNAIAATIREQRDAILDNGRIDEAAKVQRMVGVSSTAIALAQSIGQFNSGFDRKQFLDACGFDGAA